MKFLLMPLLVAAAPAAAHAAQPAPAQPAVSPQLQAAASSAWNPVAPYITAGQDEPGYRAWYSRASWRHDYVSAFHNYLTQYRVAGAVPTWQLLRTATSWHRCGGEPFEVPPVNEWPHIVQTLRYIQGFVIPAVGPVEAVSGYRNPHLNHCAGGAPESAHKSYSAIDLVPLRPTTREQLIRTLCAVHARRGTNYGVGLGFYSFLRFHVDTTKFRRWGASADCPPIIRPSDLASVAQSVEAPLGGPGIVYAPPPGSPAPLDPLQQPPVLQYQPPQN